MTGRMITYAMHQHVGVGSRSLLRMVTSFFRSPKFSPIKLLDDGRGVLGLNLGHLFVDPTFATCRKRIAALLEYARAGTVRPTVGHAFAFDDAVAAHAAIQAGTTSGKVVLRV